MARAPKEGLQYWNIDIDFDRDHKILHAKEIVDPDGTQHHLRLILPLIFVYMLDNVYKEGYYMRWDENRALTFASQYRDGLTAELVKKFVEAFLEAGLFHSGLYQSDNILTSAAIQERWTHIVKSTHRKCRVYPHFHIMDEEKSEENAKTRRKSGKRTEETPAATPGMQHNSFSISSNKGEGYGKEGIGNEVITNNNNNTNIVENSEVIHNSSDNNGNLSVQNPVDIKLSTEETLKNSEVIHKNSEETNINSDNAKNSIPIEEIPGIDTRLRLLDPTFKGDVYIGNCLYNFMNAPMYIKIKEAAAGRIPRQPHWEKLEDSFPELERWAHAFNRSQIHDGWIVRPIQGNDGWCRHFGNWLKRPERNLAKTNPDLLFTKNDISNEATTGKSSNSTANNKQDKLGGIDKSKIADFYTRKNPIRSNPGTTDPGPADT